MCVSTCLSKCPWRSGESNGSLATGVTNVCELLAAGNLGLIPDTHEINDLEVFFFLTLLWIFNFLFSFNFVHKFYMSECGLNPCMWPCGGRVSRCSEPHKSSEQNSDSSEEEDLILVAEPCRHPSFFPAFVYH